MKDNEKVQRAVWLASHVRWASKAWLRVLFIGWLVAAILAAISIVGSMRWGGAWVFIQIWTQSTASALLGGWVCAFVYWVLARSDIFEHHFIFPSMTRYIVVQIIGTVVMAVPVVITLIDPTAGKDILDALVMQAGFRSLGITIAAYFLSALALGSLFHITFLHD